MAEATKPDKGDSQDESSKKAKGLLRSGCDPSIGKATQIKPGEVRNPEGKNGHSWITDAFKLVFGDVEATAEEIRKIMKSKSAMARVMLLEHAADRIEGKVTQKIEGNLNVSLSEVISKARERAAKK